MIKVDIKSLITKNILEKHLEVFLPIVNYRLDTFIKLFKTISDPVIQKFPEELVKGRKTVLNDEIINKLKKTFINPRPVYYADYLNLLNEIKKESINFLIGDADFLRKKNKFILKTNRKYLIKTNGIPKWNDDFKLLISILKVIFPYELFINNKKAWDLYDFSKTLDVNVCPYCNINYTYTITKENKNKPTRYIARPEFDHFYCRSLFPYFGLALYNLVPSCHNCNFLLKKDKCTTIESHIHPFVNGFEKEIKFRTVFSVNDFLKTGRKTKIDIKLIDAETSNPKLLKQARSNIALFELETIYQKHKNIAEDIYKTVNDYRNENLKSICEILKSSYPDKSINEIYRFVFNNYYDSQDFGKRSLAKFTYDIAEEADFFKIIGL